MSATWRMEAVKTLVDFYPPLHFNCKMRGLVFSKKWTFLFFFEKGEFQINSTEKLAWLAGKLPSFNRRYIFKWLFFYCHVSFPGGATPSCSTQLTGEPMIWNKVGFEYWTPPPNGKDWVHSNAYQAETGSLVLRWIKIPWHLKMETCPNRGVVLVDVDYIDSIQNCVWRYIDMCKKKRHAEQEYMYGILMKVYTYNHQNSPEIGKFNIPYILDVFLQKYVPQFVFMFFFGGDEGS